MLAFKLNLQEEEDGGGHFIVEKLSPARRSWRVASQVGVKGQGPC
jgi:hypothetical protein